MNKFAIALAALGVFASGALASQRNLDPADYGIASGSAVSSPLAVASNDGGSSAHAKLIKRIMDRQDGDRS